MTTGSTKVWMMAIVLAAACEQRTNQPGVVPGEDAGTEPGTGEATGTEGTPEGTRGTNGVERVPSGAEGTNGSAPQPTPQPMPQPTTQPQPVTPGTTPGTAQAPAPATGTTTEANQATAQALQDAHQMHKHQAELARLANTKSQDPAVKAYAEQAAREHKDADDKLTQLAREKDISLDVEDAARYQNQVDTEQRLAALEGTEFDQAYIGEVVDAADRDVKIVEMVLTSTQDPQVKAYFIQLQPIVQGEADRAKKLRPAERGTQ